MSRSVRQRFGEKTLFYRFMRQYLENVRDISTLVYGYSNFHMSLLTESLAPWITVLYIRFHYRAMHFSAKRGIAIACRLSVCLSVRPSVRL